MQVCRLFLKIVKKNIGFIIMYLCIFAAITIFMFTNINSTVGYQASKINAYVEIEEENAPSKEFLSFLEEYVEVKELNSSSEVDDALFWKDIDIYIYIPYDFYDRVLKEETEIITMKTSPDSLDSYSLASTVTSYFNQVRENIRLNLCSKENALAYTMEQIKSVTIEVNLLEKNNNLLNSMFNMGAYIICALTLLLVGIISFELRTTDIARRLNIGPVSTAKRNLVLGLCYCGMSIFIVGMISVIGMALFSETIFPKLGYFVMNMSLFAVTMVFMALFLSSFFKSAIAFNCVAIILPLATAFICGSFVDLSFMPQSTQILGHIFPNIYIVKANAYINTCAEFNFIEYLKLIWPCFLFIGVFLGGSVIITNILGKSEN